MMRGRRSQSWLLAPLAIFVIMMIATSDARADAPVPGSQGTDTSLPATDSQATVRGRDQFADLEITVNQTQNLVNQAVSITWTGGAPTIAVQGQFGGNFLQIMQCWGDDDGTVPGNPGPPPEQCVQGAIASTAAVPSNVYPGPEAVTRIIGLVGWPNVDPTVGFLDTRSSYYWRPFRAVNGTVVNVQKDPTVLAGDTGNSWLNPYFNSVTTNEIAAAKTNSTGRGAELLEIHTGLQSSGLGCGQAVQPTPSGTNKIPQCWIVIVPRGDSIAENAGTAFEVGGASTPVSTSPLSPQAWKNRIAIPIGLTPVDSPCSLGVEARRLAGSELVLPALVSWQPALCADGSLPPYSYSPVSDSSARQQLATLPPGGPGMVIVSRPLATTQLDPQSPVLYAPVTVSGITVGFNIERYEEGPFTPEVLEVSGVRVAELNLTPRLVAKLLTQSYESQVAVGNQVPASYTWATNNPDSMGTDPDFLQFNPEFAMLVPGDRRTFGGLQLSSGTSDAAEQLWQWVLADPEASAWLSGQADEWGMNVNPYYSTNAQLNPTGLAFGTPVPVAFPKADPYCFQAPPRAEDVSIVPPLLCGTDWMPYSRSYAEAAKVARIAFDGAKIVENPSRILSASQAWVREAPQTLGKRAMLSLTDTPSAARYGLQMARLSRAGDNGPDRVFVAPDTAGLTAGVEAMAPGEEPQVLQADPTASAPGAYPLTMVTYAAIKPLSLDATARSEYAAFLAYASIAGQVPGFERGQLPRGYAPLPVDLQAQTLVDSVLVEVLTAPPPDPEPTTTTTTTTPETTTTTAAPTTTTTTTTPPPASTAVPTTTQVAAPPEDESIGTATPTTARRVTPSAPTPATAAPPTTAAILPTAPETSAPAAEPATTVAPPATVAPTATVAPATSVAPTTSQPPTIITPIIDVAKSRYAVPGLGVVALGSALGALEITKRSRRASPTGGDDVPDQAEDEWL